MKTMLVGATVAVLAFSVPAAAQVLEFNAGDPQERSFNVVSIDPLSLGAPVMNAPYSAEAVTEVTQVLADGNRIERRTSAMIARASDGRTRREQYSVAVPGLLPDSDSPIVTITDPRSGTHLTLNYQLKTAFRMRPGLAFSGRPSADEFRAGVLDSRAGGIEPSFGTARRGPAPPPLPPTDAGFAEPPVIIAGVEGSVAMKMAGAGAMKISSDDVRTERLESRTIEGLAAEGTRTTLTIPAGVLGNALPIEVVNERWFSPELQIVLMTRRFDPRFGETVYRLTNLSRDEPSAALFKVPAGFRLEDMTKP